MACPLAHPSIAREHSRASPGSSFQPQSYGCRVIFNPLSALADTSFGRRSLLCPNARLSWDTSLWEGLLEGGIISSEALSGWSCTWAVSGGHRAGSLRESPRSEPGHSPCHLGHCGLGSTQGKQQEGSLQSLPHTVTGWRPKGDDRHQAMGTWAHQGKGSALSPMDVLVWSTNPGLGPRQQGNQGSFCWG